ncbi:SGNH/GDSL hydrolase family protein [Gorillibacterium massiliense]|uniref:SGNH/GDSL hydrolase family protein n=1 Tax=Gorillibacterium massiliense TaxID=1280390 RepID=UPI0005929CF3|nr:SGNH/GDSL hydrolase family protein [Gorillibacterium massiliense]
MIYLALGDSITFGENASSLRNAYPQLAISALNSSSCKATGHVLAKPGWTSEDLLDAVVWQSVPLISHASVVSIWIGGVDLAVVALSSFRNQLPLSPTQIAANYRRNVRNIITFIKNESRARILICTQYNPFPNSPLAAEGIGQLNRVTNELARSCGAMTVPVHAWFEGKQAELIYGYQKGKIEDALSGFLPIHPNDRGHRVIAEGLLPYLASC